MRIHGCTAVLVGMMLCATACSPTPEIDPATARDMAYFARAAAEAERAGASEEQVAILSEAATTGVLTDETVLPLFDPFAECLAGIGGTLQFEPASTVEVGAAIPAYSIAFERDVVPDQESMEHMDILIDECGSRTITHVLKAIQLQPSTVDAWDADFARRTPAILECLADHGRELPENAPLDEIVSQSMDVMELSGVQCLDTA